MLAIFGLVAAVIATPSYPGGSGGTPYVACPSLLYSQAECCATVVLGVANLDCAPRMFICHIFQSIVSFLPPIKLIRHT